MKVFKCSCHTPEHTIMIEYLEEFDEVSITYYLNNFENIFKRLWFSFKYIFKMYPSQSHFDETLLNREKINELKQFLDDLN